MVLIYVRLFHCFRPAAIKLLDSSYHLLLKDESILRNGQERVFFSWLKKSFGQQKKLLTVGSVFVKLFVWLHIRSLKTE